MKVMLSVALLSLFLLSFSVFQASIVESSEVHDVAVTYVTAWPSRVLPLDVVHLNVTVENQGTSNESFNLTLYAAENHTIQTVSVTDLSPAESETLTFVWYVSPGFAFEFMGWLFPPPWPVDEPLVENATIWAEADTVAGEVDISDNVYVDGAVTIVWWPLDVTGSGKIDIFDVVWLVGPYGCKLGDEGYHPMLDFNQDGKIDIFDIVILIGAYGAEYS